MYFLDFNTYAAPNLAHALSAWKVCLWSSHSHSALAENRCIKIASAAYCVASTPVPSKSCIQTNARVPVPGDAVVHGYNNSSRLPLVISVGWPIPVKTHRVS